MTTNSAFTCNDESEGIFCESGLGKSDLLNLVPGVPAVTKTIFQEMSPLCDPLMFVNSGHEYRLRLKKQKLRWASGTVDDLFGDKDELEVEAIDGLEWVELECDEGINFKVVEHG